MRKILPVLIIWIACCSGSNAQVVIPHKNALRFGVGRVGLDAPDAIGYRIEAGYNRILKNIPMRVSARVGYLSFKHPSVVTSLQNRRERKTLDLYVGVRLLKSRIHNVYPNVGIALWHRDDTIIGQVQYNQLPDGTIIVNSFTTRGAQEINVGSYLGVEYEFLFRKNTFLTANFNFTNFNRAGQNSTIGLAIGTNF